MSSDVHPWLRKIERILRTNRDGDELIDVLRNYVKHHPDIEVADLAEALYWTCYGWHEGQRCELHEALCACDFRPSPISRGVTPGTLAADIHEDLENVFTQQRPTRREEF